ncbi:MAG: ribonuclease HIII [Rickettsiales bacterium]|nr:ribonuclease HIII [Rickettsiales bacterium]
MLNTYSSLDVLYHDIKHHLQENRYQINPYREIQYGIQFLISKNSHSEVLRIYKSKKGIKLDFSQIKSDTFLLALQSDLQLFLTPLQLSETKRSAMDNDVTKLSSKDDDPDDLIGVDESGKGDYFGPLVIAAVRVTPDVLPELEGLGIADSKQLSDSMIANLATLIQKKCQHAVMIMANASYNTVYEKFKNLNQLLAWAHMKVIEDTLKQGHCSHALCDQFGNASLLKNSLRTKDLNITLLQRPKAESNFSVACASIVARHHFVDSITKISESYKLPFPKGASKHVTQFAYDFIKKHGVDDLDLVAKKHFVITKQILEKLEKESG